MKRTGGRYDTRTLVIGHTQQGGAPSPADRLLATRLADAGVTQLCEQLMTTDKGIFCVGTEDNTICISKIDDAMETVDRINQRPFDPWWLSLKQIHNREQTS